MAVHGHPARTWFSRRRFVRTPGEQFAVDQLQAGLTGGVRDGDLAPPRAVAGSHPGDQQAGLASGGRRHPHVPRRIHGPLGRRGLHGRHTFAERPELGMNLARHMAQGNHPHRRSFDGLLSARPLRLRRWSLAAITSQ